MPPETFWHCSHLTGQPCGTRRRELPCRRLPSLTSSMGASMSLAAAEASCLPGHFRSIAAHNRDRSSAAKGVNRQLCDRWIDEINARLEGEALPASTHGEA